MSDEKQNIHDGDSVNLISNEGKMYAVPLKAANMSALVKTLIDENGDEEDRDIPIPKANNATLEKVIEYCTYYQEEEMVEFQDPINGETIGEVVRPTWYANYCEGLDLDSMFDLVAAANYMDIAPLSEMSALAVGLMIRGKSIFELREIFYGIPRP